MEIEVKDYFETVGHAETVIPKKRSALSLRLKPFGRLFAMKKSSASTKSSAKEIRKNNKVERRKSGSTSEVPSNYDSSCDDPSQDHRTEPTTSVESILGMSLSSRNMNRTIRRGRGISMVPALWNNEFPRNRNNAAVRAKAALIAQCYDDDSADEELPGPALLRRISSCPIYSDSLRKKLSDVTEEGVELILDEMDKKEHDYAGVEACLSPPQKTNRQAGMETTRSHKDQSSLYADGIVPKANTAPRLDAAATDLPQPRISVTTTTFIPDKGDRPRLSAAAITESTSWMVHEDFKANDKRPVKEIVFSTNEDQFDDLDDLTLPPAYVPSQKQTNRQLYSRPLYSPPFGGGSKSNMGPSPTLKGEAPAAAPSSEFPNDILYDAQPDRGYEEMFATFVQERHGSFRQGSSGSTQPQLAQELPADPLSPPRSMSDQTSELVKSDNASAHGSVVGSDDGEVVQITEQEGQRSLVTGQDSDSLQYVKAPAGRDSRASRAGSLFSLLDSRATPGSSDLDELKDQILAPDGTFEVPDRISSPHDYVKHFLGRMYRKPEASSFVPIQESLPVVATNNEVFTMSESLTKKPSKSTLPLETPMATVYNAQASATSSQSKRSEHYSASRESGTCSEDSLTRDSVMELLDMQATSSGDAESSIWVAGKKSTLLTKGSDLFVRQQSTSDDSSMSATEASASRATPVLNRFQCGGLGMYTNSNDDVSVASDNLITEIKKDLLTTVDEMKREGSFVVSKLIRQISNK
ncbi:hypothetical protein MPSEU_000174300 [Mayamaea pseudoterrestris]|nr:hypothetical protein MPSEU_000174300 [Mayamaea pseudoterrestris]